jgi:lysophospholipid acyltransferase 1/2
MCNYLKIYFIFLKKFLIIKLIIKIKANEIMNASIMYRLYYLLVSTSLQRIKFYVAWVLADAVNNASGLGFNGFDENGDYKWDLVSNINILNLEVNKLFS